MNSTAQLRISTLFALLFLFSCGESRPAGEAQGQLDDSEGSSPSTPLVICTFAPTAYLTRRLVQEDAEVRVDLPAEADALFWSPSREELAVYQTADLVVLNGAGMDTWSQRANLPQSRLVVTTANLESQLIEFAGSQETHRHGDGEEHQHVGIDPHVWLDPLLARSQAKAIHAGLEGIVSKESLDERLEGLIADLEALDQRLRRIQASGRDVLTSHPAYEYLKARYGWALVPLDLDPDAGWSPELEASLEASLSGRPADQRAAHLVWEAAPGLEVATRIKAQFGVESWVADPAENIAPDAELDWLQRQLASAEVWERVLP